MKAVIKRLAWQRNRGISQLLPSTGWSHAERMKEEAGRQRSHTPLFSIQRSLLSSCVFTPLPEEIKVNMLAYLLLPPKQDRPLPHSISCAPTSPSFSLLHPHHPSLLSSRSIDSVIWYLLVWPGNTTAQICTVSFCIFYLLCLTRTDKPVFITLPWPPLRISTHEHTCAHRRPPTWLSTKANAC